MPEKPRPIILAIDDEPDHLSLIEEILQNRFPCSILSADTPEKAITVLKCIVPNLIILDVAMPKISGLELLKLIRTNQRTHSTPVILYSASDYTGHSFDPQTHILLKDGSMEFCNLARELLGRFFSTEPPNTPI